MSDIIRLDISLIKRIEEYREKEIKFKTELYSHLVNSEDETIRKNADIALRSIEEFKNMDYKEVLRNSLIRAILSLENIM